MTRRLLAGFLALALFVLVVLEIPLAVTYAREERRALEAAVERDATVLAGIAADATAAVIADLASDYADRTGGRIVVVDAAGIGTVDTDPPAPGDRDFSTRPEIATALTGEVASGDRFSTTLDEGLLYVAVPVVEAGRVIGAVRVSYPTEALDARVRQRWALLAAVAGVVLLAAGVAGATLARSVTRPLRDLEDAAGRLAAGDLAARAGVAAGPEEVRRLGAAFDAMASQLDQLLIAQRAFVADASHQLRTPLTALRLRLENLEASVAPADAAELEAAIEETGRLSRLVDGLLVLLRADAPATVGSVDVAAVVEDRRAAWAPVAADQQVVLEASLLPGLASAVPGALEQALDNLVANALRHAPAGTTVRLDVQQVGGALEIHVTDQGPGMTAEERGRAFDRFWRSSRTRDGDGFGLGLPIVARLVGAGGGRAELRAAAGGGLDAVLVLQRA